MLRERSKDSARETVSESAQLLSQYAKVSSSSLSLGDRSREAGSGLSPSFFLPLSLWESYTNHPLFSNLDCCLYPRAKGRSLVLLICILLSTGVSVDRRPGISSRAASHPIHFLPRWFMISDDVSKDTAPDAADEGFVTWAASLMSKRPQQVTLSATDMPGGSLFPLARGRTPWIRSFGLWGALSK